jgi:hypothetical protein
MRCACDGDVQEPTAVSRLTSLSDETHWFPHVSSGVLFPDHLLRFEHFLSCRRQTIPMTAVENFRLTHAVKN